MESRNHPASCILYLDRSSRCHRSGGKSIGEVIRSIRRVCYDDQPRFWSFMHYVSTRHPEVLGSNMVPDQRDRCEEAVARANPPPVTFEESERAKMLRDLEEREGSVEPGPAPDRGSEWPFRVQAPRAAAEPGRSAPEV